MPDNPELLPFEKENIPKAADVVSEPVAMTEKKPQILADDHGRLVGSTFEDQFRIARAYHASRLMPKQLDSPEKVLVAIQLCRELGLPPITSVGKICVVNGTAAIFGDLPLALVMKSGLCQEIQESWITIGMDDPSKDLPIEKIVGAFCRVTRKGMAPIERRFTVEDAKKAGLWEKKGFSGAPSPWVFYPKRMLQMRARSWALKDRFPDVLMGITIGEYDLNLTQDLVPKDAELASQINKDYDAEVPGDGKEG